MLTNPSPNARTALASKMRPEFGCAVRGRKRSRMLQSIFRFKRSEKARPTFQSSMSARIGGSWHGLEYQDRCVLIAECLGCHVQTLELGHE